MTKCSYPVTKHAIERYLERVEGVKPDALSRSEMDRVKAIILGVPAVQIAVREYMKVTVRVAWGRIVVVDGSVVTIKPIDDQHRIKLDRRDQRSRYGRRTRAHRFHAEGASY